MNILLVWSKMYPEISYKQGMNDIIAVILYALFPYYFPVEEGKEIHLISQESLKNPVDNAKNIFMFFQNEAHLEEDAFCIFVAVFIKGMWSLFESK